MMFYDGNKCNLVVNTKRKQNLQILFAQFLSQTSPLLKEMKNNISAKAPMR